MKFIDYTEKYKIDSVSNFTENSFFKVNYGKNELRKMANDEVMRSQLINQMWLIREYNNFHKGALNRINKIDSLIRIGDKLMAVGDNSIGKDYFYLCQLLQFTESPVACGLR